MSNPRYVDDPDFYERPGETVHLTVDANPHKHVVPALPWLAPDDTPIRITRTSGRGAWVPREPCACCGRTGDVMQTGFGNLCSYCARAQARDETAKARARQPTPSRPRLSIREPWEAWQADQHDDGPSHYETGHVRDYETRIA